MNTTSKKIWFLSAVAVFVLYLEFKKGAVKGTVQQVVNESEKKDGNTQTITEFSEPKLANDGMYKPSQIKLIDPNLFEENLNTPRDGKGLTIPIGGLKTGDFKNTPSPFGEQEKNYLEIINVIF